MNERIQDFVRRRAKRCCEYCQLPEVFSSIPFEFDHVIAEQHGGKSAPANLAFTCLPDNRHKGPNLAGIDPKTGKRTWLFNPRLQKWRVHFRWEGAILIGRSAVGRTTIAVLQINAPHRIAQRTALIDEGVFPPF